MHQQQFLQEFCKQLYFGWALWWMLLLKKRLRRRVRSGGESLVVWVELMMETHCTHYVTFFHAFKSFGDSITNFDTRLP
jgi:hypothetical protein